MWNPLVGGTFGGWAVGKRTPVIFSDLPAFGHLYHERAFPLTQRALTPSPVLRMPTQAAGSGGASAVASEFSNSDNILRLPSD